MNLEAEHGYRDAIREMPSMAAMTSGSLSVAQSDWLSIREDAFTDYHEPKTPKFSLYNNRTTHVEPFLKVAN